MSGLELAIETRPAEKPDLAFIFSSWLKSFRESEFAKGIPTSLYYREHHRLIERLLERAQVLVACNPESPSQIYGWICFERSRARVIHYVYVKQPFRELGIAKRLLEAALAGEEGFFYTHLGITDGKLKERAVYSPYLLLEGA